MSFAKLIQLLRVQKKRKSMLHIFILLQGNVKAVAESPERPCSSIHQGNTFRITWVEIGTHCRIKQQCHSFVICLWRRKGDQELLSCSGASHRKLGLLYRPWFPDYTSITIIRNLAEEIIYCKCSCLPLGSYCEMSFPIPLVVLHIFLSWNKKKNVYILWDF